MDKDILLAAARALREHLAATAPGASRKRASAEIDGLGLPPLDDLRAAARRIQDGDPDLRLQTLDEPPVPYLERWFLDRPATPDNEATNAAYVHRFIAADDRVPHDHPWDSVALQLSGRLHERFRDPTAADARFREWRVEPGDVVQRPATHIHRLIPDSSCDEPPVTIFVTGPRRRTWGFWPKTAGGYRFVPFDRYRPSSIRRDRPRRGNPQRRRAAGA